MLNAFLARASVLRARDIRLYKSCEQATEALVCLMVVFSPWAFGTTQSWSRCTMNAAGYALGLLLLLKLWIRWTKGYRPWRWDEVARSPSGSRGFTFGNRVTADPPGSASVPLAGRSLRETSTRRRDAGAPSDGPAVQGPKARPELEASHEAPPLPALSPARSGGEGAGRRPSSRRRRRAGIWRLIVTLAGLTAALLVYCLISAVNARATYRPEDFSFVYHQHFIRWLPHSLDGSRTWTAFWTYLALACSFWAVWDWLLGKSDLEQLTDYADAEGSSLGPLRMFPARLRRLLWVMAINGGLLGLEGILQRLEGSGYLLFLVKPRVNPGAETQFGPYAYRANASAWFNLLWPVCLGFWWTLHRSDPSRRKAHHLLLVCAGILAASPVISTSRGGTFIALGELVAGTAYLAGAGFFLRLRDAAARQKRRAILRSVVLFGAAALTLGYALGWTNLKPRMARLGADFTHREDLYDRARPMAADYPVFGTGPGTFGTVFQFYRDPRRADWPAQLHNDWLETRITFGWVGSALIALAFVTVLARSFVEGGIPGARRLVTLTWLALAGCLVHARYDFPFQIHSIVFLFVMLCAILFNLRRRA